MQERHFTRSLLYGGSVMMKILVETYTRKKVHFWCILFVQFIYFVDTASVVRELSFHFP